MTLEMRSCITLSWVMADTNANILSVRIVALILLMPCFCTRGKVCWKIAVAIPDCVVRPMRMILFNYRKAL